MRERDDLAKLAIPLRPLRWFVPIFGGGAAATILIIVIGSIIVGREPAAVAIWLGVLGAIILVMVNYLWYHYVTIDDNGVHQVKYLGLVKKPVRMRELTRVGTRPIEVGGGPNDPSVQFRSAHSVIEIMSHSYPTEPVREALAFLKGKGIPVDAKLLREIKIE